MSFLVSLVITAANFETLALANLIYNHFLVTDELATSLLEERELAIFTMAPGVALAILLIFNICVTCSYLQSSRKPATDSSLERESYQEWSSKMISCSRILCLTASLLLSFQNTSWLNIRG